MADFDCTVATEQAQENAYLEFCESFDDAGIQHALNDDGSVNWDDLTDEERAKVVPAKKTTPDKKRHFPELEEKIRHVRSQEGARRFKLPIGSPIIARSDPLVVADAEAAPKPIVRDPILDTPDRPLDPAGAAKNKVELRGDTVLRGGRAVGKTYIGKDGYLAFDLADKLHPSSKSVSVHRGSEQELAAHLWQMFPTVNWLPDHGGLAYTRGSQSEVRATARDSKGALHRYKILQRGDGTFGIEKYGTQSNSPVGTYHMKGRTQAEASRIIHADMKYHEALTARNKQINLKGKNFAGYYVGVYDELRPIVDGDSLPFEFPDAIIDTKTGYAINIPLGVQAPTQFWDSPKGQQIKEWLYMLRQQANIEVEDDLLEAPDPVEVNADALDYYRNLPEGTAP